MTHLLLTLDYNKPQAIATMTMKQSSNFVEVDPWELIILRKLLLFHNDAFPKATKVLIFNTLMYGVDYKNIRDFVSFAVKILRQYDIKMQPLDIKYEEYTSLEKLDKIKWLDSTEEVYEKAITASPTIEFGKTSIQRIRERLIQLTQAFINNDALFWSQFGISPYTYDYQRANFLNNIQSYIDKYGSSFHLYAQTDFKIFGEEQKKTNFLASLLALEYEDFIRIQGVSFSRIDISDNKSREDLSVLIRMGSKLLPLKNTPPKPWELVKEEAKAYLKKDGQVVFTFPSNTSNQFRYFKCIWNKYGQRATYQEVYEFESNLKYPNQKGKNWKINDLIRNTVRKLKKQLQGKNVPIQIDVNRGFVLTVKTS